MLALVAFGEPQGVAQMRFWSPKKVLPPNLTSEYPLFSLGKQWFLVFKHNVCIEIGRHGIGAQKNGLLAAVWLIC